jgi:hypothetical protein
MKKPKPQAQTTIRTITVETEGEFRKVRQLFPSIDPIRYNDYLELRLPLGAYVDIKDRACNVVRLKTK